jgi:hypothetical protein
MLGRQALPERDPPEAPPTLPGADLSIAALRGAMEPFCRKRNAYALGLLTFDLALFGAGQWLAVTATQTPGSWRSACC